MEKYYEEALKAGQKEFKAREARGEFPYLPVLDQILKESGIRTTEESLGLIKVPLDQVVGTVTEGRTYSFAANFMPIMSVKTEFAMKWEALAEAQVTEGIRDPIKAYEYMNRYYALEGNKRVSVLKSVGATEIYAYVTRKLPIEKNSPEVRRYLDLLKFIQVTGKRTIEFSRNGHALGMLKMIGKGEQWTDADREEFNKVVFQFEKAYNFRGGRKLSIPLGEALYAFMTVYSYPKMVKMTDKEYNDNIIKIWDEFLVLASEDSVELVMDPLKEQKSVLKSLTLIPGLKKQLQISFLYPKAAEESQWIYGHELGRNYLDQTFPTEVHTRAVENVDTDNIESVLEAEITAGADIIFGVGPQLLGGSLEAAAAHPGVEILNCSLNTAHKLVHTYYARMYEGKFISGMIAGAMAANDKVAYIADYPIYGMIANINAFALGARMTNPRVQVYLDWSTRKDFDRRRFLEENGIYIVSDQDMVAPKNPNRTFGLYHYNREGKETNLVMPLWNWGVFYERLIKSIMAGSFKAETASDSRAQNFWWGMSAGVIDIIMAKQVPAGLQRLADRVRVDIIEGRFRPFEGEILAQDGSLKCRPGESITPADIMKMDYLVENIVGEIPDTSNYVDQARKTIEAKGIKEQS